MTTTFRPAWDGAAMPLPPVLRKRPAPPKLTAADFRYLRLGFADARREHRISEELYYRAIGALHAADRMQRLEIPAGAR